MKKLKQKPIKNKFELERNYASKMFPNFNVGKKMLFNVYSGHVYDAFYKVLLWL